MPDVKRGVTPSGQIPDEVARFPNVVSTLKTCESKVVGVSKKTGVHLEILYDGGAGVTTFRIGTKIDSPSSDAEALKHQIANTASALREAYDETR